MQSIRSISQATKEKLAALETASNDISSDLVVLRSDVLAMNPSLQGMHSTVSGVETRFNVLEGLMNQLLSRLPPDTSESSHRVSKLSFLARCCVH